MQYTVTYYTGTLHYLHGSAKSILDMISMLEDRQVAYKVGTIGYYLSPRDFGWDGFEYWKDASFVWE